MVDRYQLKMYHINLLLNWMNDMRFLLGLIILISFDFRADERDGLPELATEEQKRELQSRRSKVLTASTARRVQKIVEVLMKQAN